MRPRSVRPNQRLQEASGRHCDDQKVDSPELEALRPRNAPSRPPGAGGPSDFHTAWAMSGHKPKTDQNNRSAVYENLPQTRSVAHQMILLPNTIRTPKTSQPNKSTDAMPNPRTSTGTIMAR